MIGIIGLKTGGLSLRLSREEDIEIVSRDIRKEDEAEVFAVGYTSVRGALEDSFACSPICLTVESDGVPLALFGLVPESEAIARVWMLGGTGISKHPVAFVKLSKVVIGNFLGTFPKLWNIVDDRYSQAIKWLKMNGAVFDEATFLLEGSDVPFRAFEIRRK